MGNWFCIWDDLANPKKGLNLVQNPLITRTLYVIFECENEKMKNSKVT